MSVASANDLAARTRRVALEALAETCWAQWGTLGFMAGGDRSDAGTAFIDPEALLLMTFDAVRAEPRLDQALSWWAVVGADLISLPRLDALRAGLPERMDAELAAFAARVAGAGSASPAWRRRAGGAATEPPERLKGVTDPGTGRTTVRRPALRHPAAAMVRLRAIAGVGAKADVIACLAASDGAQSVRALARALGYSALAVRRAAEDLVAADVAQATHSRSDGGTRQIRYAYRPGTLTLGALPPWRHWPQIAAFLLYAARWGEGFPTEPTPYQLASRARDLHAFAHAFDLEHPVMPTDALPRLAPRQHPGEAYLEPFAETVEVVAAWVRAGLPGASLHGSHRWFP